MSETPRSGSTPGSTATGVLPVANSGADKPAGDRKGMSVLQATVLEMSIIGLCIVALILVFQPYSLRLFSIGAVLVIVGGLAFNLVPFCRAGEPFSAVVRVTVIVLISLLVITALAIGSAYLYGVYITNGG